VISIKGMRFRPKIEEHDYQFKMRHVSSFLLHGNKVKCFVLFRGREKAHTEFGYKILMRLSTDLIDIATIENQPRLEGNSMSMLLSPRPPGARKTHKDKPGILMSETPREVLEVEEELAEEEEVEEGVEEEEIEEELEEEG